MIRRFLTVCLAAWCLHAAVKWVLDRRRLRQWAAGWQVVEPVWATRRG